MLKIIIYNGEKTLYIIFPKWLSGKTRKTKDDSKTRNAFNP